jgi:choline transport protein
MVSVKGDVEKSVNMSVSSGNLEKTASVTVGAVPPHANELRQNFSLWSLASLCLCLVATWEALTSVVAAALTNGGAPCLFYN